MKHRCLACGKECLEEDLKMVTNKDTRIGWVCIVDELCTVLEKI